MMKCEIKPPEMVKWSDVLGLASSMPWIEKNMGKHLDIDPNDWPEGWLTPIEEEFTDWGNVEVDALVDSQEDIAELGTNLRYFSHEDDGKLFYFEGGRTSITSNGSLQISRKGLTIPKDYKGGQEAWIKKFVAPEKATNTVVEPKTDFTPHKDCTSCSFYDKTCGNKEVDYTSDCINDRYCKWQPKDQNE